MTKFTECECDGCGDHMVIDHDAVEAFLNQETFRCTDCGRELPIQALNAIVNDQPLRGVCHTCVIVMEVTG